MADALGTHESIAAAALAEVKAPQLAVTEQFFAVHRLAEPNPVADIWRSGDSWLVSLRLHEEPYFWVAVVKQSAKGFENLWGGPQPLANVSLAVHSKTLDAAQITSALGLAPLETRRKGDFKLNGRSPLRFEEHRWYYRADCPEALDCESKLSRLLEDLSKRSERYQSIRKESEAFVLVGLHEYAGSPGGWHLDLETIRRLDEFGLEVNVDLYVSGPELPDSEVA